VCRYVFCIFVASIRAKKQNVISFHTTLERRLVAPNGQSLFVSRIEKFVILAANNISKFTPKCIYIYIYIYIHTHTDTHTHILQLFAKSAAGGFGA
jgi:hypothetical protein